MVTVTIFICYHWTPVINWCRRVPAGNYMMTETERKLSFTNTSSHPALHTNTDIISHLLLLPDTEQHGAENCYGNWRRNTVWSPHQSPPHQSSSAPVVSRTVTCSDEDEGRKQWKPSGGLIPPEELQRVSGCIAVNHQVLHLFTKITRPQTGTTGLEPNYQWHFTERLSGDCSGLVTRNSSSLLPYCYCPRF